jgi:hypothetical protein
VAAAFAGRVGDALSRLSPPEPIRNRPGTLREMDTMNMQRALEMRLNTETMPPRENCLPIPHGERFTEKP